LFPPFFDCAGSFAATRRFVERLLWLPERCRVVRSAFAL